MLRDTQRLDRTIRIISASVVVSGKRKEAMIAVRG
jgi:hypothetical protein